MARVIVRRNFGCGAKLSAFAHRRHRATEKVDIPSENEFATLFPDREGRRSPIDCREAQEDRLAFLAYVSEEMDYGFSEWEGEFLDSVSERVAAGLLLTVKQMEVVERIIRKASEGKAMSAAYKRHKARQMKE